MKRTIKAGFILVLVAFFSNLMFIVNASGYWSETGAAMEDANVKTDFGDWEYFYYEPFTNRASNLFGFSYEIFDNVKISSDGRIIGRGNANSIDGRGVLLAPIFNIDHWEITKTFQMELPRGLGGFSFDYKNVGNIGEKLHVQVFGEDTETELINEEIDFKDTDVVHNVRYDFNVPSSNKTVTLKLITQPNAKVVIDNIKWSDHNIKIDFHDGYNNNDLLTTKYIRYGRTALEYEEELKNIKPGYELIDWYTDPNLSKESKYDFNTPVREDIKLYSNWQIIYYDIEYDLNGGYFEPFTNRDEMITTFLTDFYNYLNDNNLLTGTDFHTWLMDEGFANEEISLDDFIYGTGYTASNPKEGKYDGIYDGLFTKGFVPVEPEVGENFTISFDLNGGIFPNIGTTKYTNRTEMITDFLTDFWTFLGKPGTLNDFMHGVDKISGFNGIYNQSIYFNRLYEPNNKNVNPSTKKFVNQPEYNKWVLLIDLMDEYSKFNPEQSFWGSTYIGSLRFKPFILRRNLWSYVPNNTVWEVTDRIPNGLEKGGTQQNVPTEYEGGTEMVLPIPTRYDSKTFKGWYEYDYKTKKFIGPVTKITTETLGNKDYYALWNDVNDPKPKPESPLGIKLREDSYFNQLYEMSALYTDETETEYNRDFSDLEVILAVDPSRPYFINQPEYNKWHHLLQLIHEYTILGNKAQWFGLWKSYYTGAIRMEMFFQQYNPWPSQESEERFIVFEMLRRIPYNIPKESIPYRYTIEDELITLPRPIKEHVDDKAEYAGWYENPDFSGNAIDEIPAGSTGDKKYYARFAEKKFTIDYELNGGKFAPYTNRDEMVNDFLDDFYDFVKDKLNSEFEGITRDVFKHGVGKTNGFNGVYTDYIYYNDKKELIPVQLLFATGDKTINPRTGRFINQEDHNNRWLPLLELAAEFTQAIDSKDNFWATPKLAAERLKQLFTKNKPPLAPTSVDKYFSKIPTNISKVKVPKFYVNDTETLLPEAVLDGKRFIGWYTDKDFTENAWESIPIGTSENLTLYAKWYEEGSYEVTYDFGEYGYHGTTRNDYFRWFVSDYIDEFKLDVTEEVLYSDFFNNSQIQEGADLREFKELFVYKLGRWAWAEDYILSIVGESYEFYDELIAYDQVIWRLNIDALFNQTQKSFIKHNEEGQEITVSSGDFSSIENANSFWKNTPYNEYKTQIIPGGDLFPEEFVNGWHPGYKFTGWHLLDGTKVTKLPEDPTNNITLIAHWETEFDGITVIFLDYDDKIIATKEVPEGGILIDIPEDPERPYYTFIGWYDGVTEVDFSKEITKSLIVKAEYENDTYTLTFETFGGTEIDEQQLVYPNLPEKPLDPERVGFTFAGWFKDENYQNEFFFEFPLYADTIIYAKWDPITYNIAYHLNGGEFVTNNGTNPDTYTTLDIITLSLATKENHQFIGWYLSEDFSGDVITVIKNMFGDLNLYAKYELNTYKVVFNPNNGEETTTLTIEHGEKVTKPEDPIKEGYNFDAWAIDGKVFNFDTPITEDITLVAHYDISQFKVTYKNYDGTVLNEQTINFGQFAVVPEVPKRDGYSGVWDEDLTNVPIIENYEINPIYTVIEYTIYYHLDGGINSTNNPKTYNIEDIIELENATKDGYEFMGWYLNMDRSGDPISLIENIFGNLNLYAKFELKEYNITYLNIEGATHNNQSKYNIYDVLILEDAFKEGYFFKGWYLDEDFTNKIEIIENRFEDLTIYANFSDMIEYNINYVLYPNSAEPNDPAIFNQEKTKYTTDEKVILETPEDRVSSVFKGWYQNDAFTGDAITEIVKGSTGDKTFYAKWELKEYKIEIYNNKQEIIDNLDPYKIISPIYHSSIISIEDYDGAIEEGYEFIGWHYLNNDVSVLFDQEQQINRSYKLYPEFSLKQYKVTFIVDNDVNYQFIVYHNELLPNIPDSPTKDGIDFLGWYLEDGTEFNENDPITRDYTILAKWSIDGICKVTFLNEDGTIYSVMSVNVGDFIEKPTDPTKVGHGFSGWYLNGSETAFDFDKTAITENITLRAKFTLNSYTIKFDSNEGSYVEPITAPYGSGINAPVAPTKAGNLFIDWYTDEDLTIPYTFKTMPAEDITLYAKWIINQYQVRFFAYDNILIETKFVDYNTTVEPPKTIPVKEHYEHTGWDKPLTNITKNTDITATYRGKTYKVTFDTQGGTSVSPQNVTYPNRAQRPTDPTREGYIFAGWHNGLDTSEFNFNSIITSNITITAKWADANVTVTFDYDYNERTESVLVRKGEKVNKPDNPDREGFIFDDWYLNDVKFDFNDLIYEDITLIAKYQEQFTVNYLNEDDTVIKSFGVVKGDTIKEAIPLVPEKDGYDGVWDQDLKNFVITENIDVRPNYTPITYTITYSNLLVGVTHSNRTTYKITDNTFNLNNPTNIPEGNTFVGWYLNDVKIDKIQQGSFGNKVIAAKWELTDYNIYYNLNGGDFLYYDDRNEMIEDFLTDFYNFINPAGVSLNDFMRGAGNTSGFDGLYNSEDYFSQLYDANVKGVDSSTGKFINQPQYNKWVPLLDLIDEYTSINPEQTGQFWSSPKWVGIHRIKPFIQKRNMWPDDGVDAKVTEVVNKIPAEYNYKVYCQYNLETKTIDLPVPIKSNQEFVGWYTNPSFTGAKVTTIPAGSTGDKTFYAKWSISEYSINYNLQGGVFSTHNTKEDMTNAFLQDLYDFVNATEDLNTFMHGEDKTSGFNGTWYNNEEYRNKIFKANTKSGNNAYFLSSSTYQSKWKPFADLMVIFVKAGNPDQDFWSSPYTGNKRIWEYFRNVKPGNAWTDSDMEMLPKTLISITVPTSYQEGNREIILPLPTRSNYYFKGWYTNKNYTGNPVTRISKNSTGDKTYYAKWEIIIDSGSFVKQLLTQSGCYQKNINKDSGYPRELHKGVIVHSVGYSGATAAGLYNTWNTASSNIALHALVDDKKMYQYLEWDFRAYHTADVGNKEYVGIMIVENSGYSYSGNKIVDYNVSEQEAYFNAAWDNAVNLTVHILKHYNLPVNEDTVIGRHEAFSKDIAINDVVSPGLLFDQHNKTMADFRADVRARM